MVSRNGVRALPANSAAWEVAKENYSRWLFADFTGPLALPGGQPSSMNCAFGSASREEAVPFPNRRVGRL